MTHLNCLYALLLLAAHPAGAETTLLRSAAGQTVSMTLRAAQSCDGAGCRNQLCLSNLDPSGGMIALRIGPTSPLLQATLGQTACQRLGQARYRIVLYAGVQKPAMVPVMSLPLDLRARSAVEIDLTLQPPEPTE